MNGKRENSINEIKTSLENLLNTKTTLKIRRVNKEDKEFEIFEKLITSLEELDVRSYILEKDLQLDLNNYNKKFYNIIDSLIEIHFGHEITTLIMFYLYDRNDTNHLTDNEGKVVPLNNVMDLWNLIQVIKESKKKNKKEDK